VGGVKIRAFFGVSVEFIPRPTGGGCDRSPSCTIILNSILRNSKLIISSLMERNTQTNKTSPFH
jgi:hypothetical protein